MGIDAELHTGDCLSVLGGMPSDSVDLVYLDPPFFTQKKHCLSARYGEKEYSFDDLWSSNREYGEFILFRVAEMYRVLSRTGSLYFHCDTKATHIIRAILDEVFGATQFQSEIIWTYRRWSNSCRKLLPAHQTILYYTKSDDYTFNQAFQDYSPSTNVDQILQKRTRDERNKSAYLRDDSGEVVTNGAKKGVPLGDVWDIPYLNPKATERTGYPTQKPLLLLERILELSTDEGDTVLDPFCGSGTTLIAACLLNRRGIGIDVSEDAIELTRNRLKFPQRTESNLLRNGRESYKNADKFAAGFLHHLECNFVQRNKGIDAILKEDYKGSPVPVRVQRLNETISEAAGKLLKASYGKNAKMMFLIATSEYDADNILPMIPKEIQIIEAATLQIKNQLRRVDLVASAKGNEPVGAANKNQQTFLFD